jgi:hypothetical protein
MKPYYAVSKRQLGKTNIGTLEQQLLTQDNPSGGGPGPDPDPDPEANPNLNQIIIIQNHL